MHVPVKSLKSYPWWLKPFFWSQKRRYGKVLKPGLLWARVPRLFAAVAALYGVLDRKSSPVSPQLRSLVTVRVSQINWCEFCVDINAMTLAKRAGSTEKVNALENWQNSPLFDEKERVALKYTEAVTYSDRHVTPELMSRVKRHFDEDAVVELTGLIAFQNLSSKFNAALDVPAEGFCKIPAKPARATHEEKQQ
ncbi:carboxymuconolactone decarboxylase family protein [Endozoicomonas sp. Mp262]|uniref:carboxymuconolactone decarboxylase family protein n=1 Tax=Endozoicomonas sp. Mp262 TaxID=2919499 RepID=UPI0021D9CC67